MALKRLKKTHRQPTLLISAPGPDFGSQSVYYEKYYQSLPCGNEDGFVSKLAHKAMERDFNANSHFPNILEVGAGDGLHLKYINHKFELITMTDLSVASLDKIGLSPKHNCPTENCGHHFKALVMDAEKLEFEPEIFDRTIASCLLLHLTNPEAALKEWKRVTKHGGYVTIYVPNEPGLLVRLGRALTTKRVANSLGYKGFDLLMAREHRIHGWGLDQMIKYVFADCEIAVAPWPFRLPFFLRIFNVYQIKINKDVN